MGVINIFGSLASHRMPVFLVNNFFGDLIDAVDEFEGVDIIDQFVNDVNSVNLINVFRFVRD